MTPPGTEGDCPVDVDILDTLRELADEDTPDFFTDLVQSYIADAAQLGEQLTQAVADQDIETVARSAHTLKSSSGNVGAGNLAGLCATIENQARTHQNLEGAEQGAQNVAAELKVVIAYLSSLI